MQRPHLFASFGLLSALLASPAAMAACEGDFNGDGIVDAADLAIMFSNFGIPGAAGDVNGDGIVDGSDIGFILSVWGPCAATCTSYQSLNYVGVSIGGIGHPLPQTILSGNVNVFPSGEPQGLLVAASDGSIAVVQLALASVSIFIDTSFVLLPANAPPDLVFIDGVPTTITAMLESFEFDLQIGLGASQWSVPSRAILALAALAETEPFSCDLTISLEDASPSAAAFWCKAGLASVGGGIVARAISDCAEFETICNEGGVAAIGEFAMPCSSLNSVCLDGEFAGSDAVFNAVLSLWLGK